MSALARAVAAVERRLCAIYQIELDVRAEQFLVSPEQARRLLPAPCPPSGVVVVEADDGPWVGLYVDPGNPGAIVEETSHLLCLAWHAAHDRPVSRLILELQAEVDRYVLERLAGRDGLSHFEGFRWADWMDPATRHRYEKAHQTAHRYCRSLTRRFKTRTDTPALLDELRRFYRSTPERKLAA